MLCPDHPPATNTLTLPSFELRGIFVQGMELGKVAHLWADNIFAGDGIRKSGKPLG